VYPLSGRGEHLGVLVERDDVALPGARQLDCDRGRPGGDIENRGAGTGGDSRDEEPSPARVLAEREQPCVAVVRRAERGEELLRVALPGGRGFDHCAAGRYSFASLQTIV
jgi:hypothetical protein